MITVGLIFLVTLGLLQLVGVLAGPKERWMGLNATFMKVNLALLVTSACSSSRFLGAAPLEPVLATFVAIALLDILWAGYLGRREQSRGRGRRSEQN